MSKIADTCLNVNGSPTPMDDGERAILGILPEDPEDGTVEVPLSERLRTSAASRALPAADAPMNRLIVGLPPGWVTPEGWILGPHGVWEIAGSGRRERTVLIAARPIWIAARLRDVDTGRMFLRIAWPGGSATIEREAALCQRSLLRLAGEDAPVSSQSAAGVVRWLEAAEAANRDTLPMEQTVGRLGWIEGRDGAAPVWQGPEGPLTLRAQRGEAQQMAAMKPRGTWEGWRDLAARVHAASPVALMTLAASVGSALMARIGPLAAPFVVDLSGGSGKGKTVALRWAASAWACPTDRAVWIKPWSSSSPSIESFAWFLQHAPLMLDDTRKLNLRRRQELGGSVYQWASGQGAGKGHPDGAREVRTWHSVVFSTGEVPLPSIFGQDIGLRMRMVRIEDDPFVDGDPLVTEIEGIETWGHAGPRVAAWAVEQGDAALRAAWLDVRGRLAARLAGAATAAWCQRASGYGATIWMGLMALNEIGVEVRPPDEAAAIIVGWLRAGIESADVPGAAWDRLCAWLASQSGRIVTHAGPEPHAPPGGWIGRTGAVKLDSGDAAEAVYVLPSAVDAELRRWGYDPDDVLPVWAKRGLLVEDAKQQARARAITWLGKKVRLYCLRIDGWTGMPEEAGEVEKERWN